MAMIDDDRAHWDEVDEATELLHEERFHEALVELKRVLRANPKNPYGYYFLGIALFESGELAAARDAYRACLTLAPQHLGARVSLCHVLRALAEYRDAIREGLRALSQAPDDGDVLHAVGLAYHARGDLAAARKYLTAFLNAKPELEVSLEVQALLAAMEEGGDAG